MNQALLRTVCAEDEPSEQGEHKHKCKDCGIVWKHDDSLQYGGCTRAEFKLAHDCPKCGRNERQKYFNDNDDVDAGNNPIAKLLLRMLLCMKEELADA